MNKDEIIKAIKSVLFYIETNDENNLKLARKIYDSIDFGQYCAFRYFIRNVLASKLRLYQFTKERGEWEEELESNNVGLEICSEEEFEMIKLFIRDVLRFFMVEATGNLLRAFDNQYVDEISNLFIMLDDEGEPFKYLIDNMINIQCRLDYKTLN